MLSRGGSKYLSKRLIVGHGPFAYWQLTPGCDSVKAIVAFWGRGDFGWQEQTPRNGKSSTAHRCLLFSRDEIGPLIMSSGVCSSPRPKKDRRGRAPDHSIDAPGKEDPEFFFLLRV